MAVKPMKQAPLLSRTTLGQPNYLLIAAAAMFAVAFVPFGVWQAVRTSTNRPDQWLGSSHASVQDLDWVRTQFGRQQPIIVSWDGCTMGDTRKLDLLAKKLAPGSETLAASSQQGEAAPNGPWFSQVIAGPTMLARLQAAPYNLSYSEAIKRLEGSLVGPPQRNAQGQTLGDDSRATCLVAQLTPVAARDESTIQAAIDKIVEIARIECGIDAASIHLAGAPVEQLAVASASRTTLLRWGTLAAMVGAGLCFWRLGSAKLSAMVMGIAVACAGISLAIVFYSGIIEKLALGAELPQLATADAVAMLIPAVAYVTAVFGAIHLIHYYRDERQEHGIEGAAERAMSHGWRPLTIAAAATALGVAALLLSEVLPVKRFGLFTGVGVIAAIGLVMATLPVLLSRRPPDDDFIKLRANRLRRWVRQAFEFGLERPAPTVVAGLALTLAVGLGMLKLEPILRMPALLAGKSDVVRDGGWFESKVGNVEPLDVVLTVPYERRRTAAEAPEGDGQQYRLTMLEGMQLMQEIQRRAGALPEISGAISAATFLPAGAEPDVVAVDDRATVIPENYLSAEQIEGSDETTGRELWRLSALMTRLSADGAPPDFNEFIGRFRAAVDDVLLAYEQRDWLVRNLHERGQQLAGAKVCVLFNSLDEAAAPPEGSQEWTLAELLRRSGVADGGVSSYNLALWGKPAAEAQREPALSMLASQHAVILTTTGPHDDLIGELFARGGNLVDVSRVPTVEESAAATLVDSGGPRPIRGLIAGMAPVAHATQQQLLATLRKALPAAAALICVIMVAVQRNVVGGLCTMLPILLPLAIALGALGWLGATVDVTIVLIAAVALAVGMSGAAHFLSWFRRGVTAGLNHRDAATQAFDRCAGASIDATLVAGASLTVLALNAIAGVQQFALLAAPIMIASLAGSLVLLPAMATGPLRRFFGVDLPLANELVDEPVAAEPEAKPAEKLVAAVAALAPPVRPRPTITVDERHEAAEGPHSELHAKLRKLRRSAGDSPSS